MTTTTSPTSLATGTTGERTPYGRYLRLLARYLRPHWRATLALTLALLGSIGMQLARPQIVRGFIDAAQAQADVDKLLAAALTFLGIGLVAQVLNVAATYLSTDLGFSATNALRADLAAHLLTLDMSFHNEHTPGEMIERVDGDITAVSNFFSQFVIRLAGSALLIAGVLVMLFREDWRVGLALSAFAIGALLVMNRLRDVAVEDSTADRQASAELFGLLEERLEGLDDLRANGMAAYTMLRFHEKMRAFVDVGHKAWMARSVVWRTIMTLFGLAVVMALGIGAALYRQGAFTLGAVYLLLNYTQMLFDPLEQVAHQLQDLQKAAAGLGRVTELLDLRSSLRDGPETTFCATPENGNGVEPDAALSICAVGVSFAYSEDQPVLQDVTFTLRQGRTMGLLGRTGSGKTTLTRLLFRLYDANRGVIRIGGRDVRDLRLDALRRRVCMVTQDVQLFSATVRDNLTFFDPQIADEQIVSVLHELGMGEWFARLPKGLDTELTAGGGDLSAGEAQVLAFARAFLQDPGLVILDEPSSRLDPATEHLLERAMNRLLHGRTGIIIAHRLATVQRVDEIMIMEDGRIREHGPRAALAHDPRSRFYELLHTGLEEAFA